MPRNRNVRLAGLTALAAAGLLAIPGVASATVSTNLVGGQLTVFTL